MTRYLIVKTPWRSLAAAVLFNLYFTEIGNAATLIVVTTVAPITDMVRQVAGDQAMVIGLIPEGVNSHTYEPSPSHAKVLAKADIIIVNGLHLETPTLKLAGKVKREETPVIRLGDRTISRKDWKFDFSFPEAKGHPNPHLWPNVALTMAYVDHIRDALSSAAPEQSESFKANAVAYRAELQKLDAAIFKCVASIPSGNRKLVTYHDSFAYFAPRYGMTVIGAVQPADFAEPTPRDVGRMILQIRNERIPAIFGSEVFPSPILEQIAREAGAAYVDQLRDDDLPGEPGESNHSFIGMMVSNVKTMAASLGGDPSCMAHLND